MNRRTAVLVQSLVVLALFAVPSMAEDEEALTKDLTAMIALQGLPCGQVIAVEQNAESDFSVSCTDGQLHRVYLTDGQLHRVYLNATGRWRRGSSLE
jgi:hypothetical protein